MFEAKLEYANGDQYFQVNLSDEYFIDYVDRQSNILVVTFFAKGMVTETIQTDYPWGYQFLTSYSVSVLGIKPAKTDWYRGKSLHEFMRSEALSDFVKPFDRIILYGGSMGGYAALAFAEAFPNPEVIAFSPQITLDRRRVPWEQRFMRDQTQEWDGDFADPCASIHKAKRVWVIYDPLEPSDRRQVNLLPSGSATLISVPLVGHATPVWLSKMGLLRGLFGDIFEDRFDPRSFRQDVRKRRGLVQYYVQMGEIAGRRRPKLRDWCLIQAERLGISMTEQTTDAKVQRAALIAEKREAARLQLQRDQAGRAAARRASLDAAAQAREARVREHEQLRAERATAADVWRKTLKSEKPPKN